MAARRRGRPAAASCYAIWSCASTWQAGWQRGGARSRSARRCARSSPPTPRHLVHETIYQAIYRPELGGLCPDLRQVLRTGRRHRKRHRRADARRTGVLTDMISISQRPAEAASRAVAGHWEGDLIMGHDNKSAIGTLVDRASRFTILLHLPGPRHTTETVTDSLIAALEPLPASCAARCLGPGQRDGPARPCHACPRNAGVLLRPALAMAAPDERKYKRAAPPVLPQGHRPDSARPAPTPASPPSSTTAAQTLGCTPQQPA